MHNRLSFFSHLNLYKSIDSLEVQWSKHRVIDFFPMGLYLEDFDSSLFKSRDWGFYRDWYWDSRKFSVKLMMVSIFLPSYPWPEKRKKTKKHMFKGGGGQFGNVATAAAHAGWRGWKNHFIGNLFPIPYWHVYELSVNKPCNLIPEQKTLRAIPIYLHIYIQIYIDRSNRRQQIFCFFVFVLFFILPPLWSKKKKKKKTRNHFT